MSLIISMLDWLCICSRCVAVDWASVKHTGESWISRWNHVWIIQYPWTLHCCAGEPHPLWYDV